MQGSSRGKPGLGLSTDGGNMVKPMPYATVGTDPYFGAWLSTHIINLSQSPKVTPDSADWLKPFACPIDL